MNRYNINNPNIGTSQHLLTRRIGPSVQICPFNIEGISKSKSDHLSKLLLENDVDVAVIQETHTISEAALKNRGSVAGYSLIGAIYHSTYESATYVKNNIGDVKLSSVSSDDDIYTIAIEIGGLNIFDIYKPPSTRWPTNALPTSQKPSVYIGDFNSHHRLWKYATNDKNGEKLLDWAESNQLHLVCDAKDKATFHSGRWGGGYNPDLCFVSCSLTQRLLPASRTVLSNFPRSQFNIVQ